MHLGKFYCLKITAPMDETLTLSHPRGISVIQKQQRTGELPQMLEPVPKQKKAGKEKSTDT